MILDHISERTLRTGLAADEERWEQALPTAKALKSGSFQPLLLARDCVLQSPYLATVFSA